jgi:hypothetical protein
VLFKDTARHHQHGNTAPDNDTVSTLQVHFTADRLLLLLLQTASN